MGGSARTARARCAATDEAVRVRRSSRISGIVTIALAVTAKGDLAGVPDVMTAGMPAQDPRRLRHGRHRRRGPVPDLRQLPRQKRRDADVVSNAIEKAVRNAIASAWGKRPTVHVLVVEV